MAYMTYTQKQSAPSLRKADLALAVLFCAALGIGCLTIIVRMGTRALYNKNLCPQKIIDIVFFDSEIMRKHYIPREQLYETASETNDIVDWQTIYPLSSETESFYEGTIDSRDLVDSLEDETGRLVLQIPTAVTIIEKLDTWLNDRFFAYYFFVKMMRRIQKPLGVLNEALRNEGGQIIRLPNGHFTGFTKKIDTSPVAASLIRFNEFLSTRGIPFLYVQGPHKVDPADTSVSGKLDFSNQNADELLHLIDGTVDYLDLRDEMQKAGMNHYDNFYLTDHHWKTETCFWAARVIAQRLNADFQLTLDDELLAPANFNFKVMPESYLGSQGRAATLVGTGMDDFTLITPKDEYDLDVEIYSLTNLINKVPTNLIRKTTGGFETLLFFNQLQTEETVFSRKGAYCIYLNGDSLRFIKNKSAQNGLKILLVGDSFAYPVQAFLSLCVNAMDGFDLRYFNGSLSAFIDAHEYDACVALIGAGAIGPNAHFDFR